MALLSRLDRYIAVRIVSSTLLVFAVVLSLTVFVQAIDELDNYGKGGFNLAALVTYVALSVPARFYELFPIVVLLGTVMGLSSLATGSELTAMRAAGISVARIIGSVMKIGLIFVVASVALGETLVPASDAAAQRGRAQALNIALHRKATGLWLRDGSSFVNVGEVLPDLTLLDINIYRFDHATQLRTQTFAKRAHFESPNWRLEEVNESRVSGEAVQTSKAQHLIWQSVITPDVMGMFAVRPQSLATVQLYDYIRHLRHNRQGTDRYELAFWQKLLLPAATAVMILLAVPAAFGQLRSGGVGQKLFLGILLGLGFALLNRTSGYLAVLYGLPPPLAALLPVGFFLLLALHLLRRLP